MAGQMMQAGKLRHYVTVQTYTASADAYGQQSLSWGTHANWWTEKIEQPSRELQTDGKYRNFQRVQFRGRDVSGITPDMRILDGTATYDIISIVPDPTYERQIIVQCGEESPNV